MWLPPIMAFLFSLPDPTACRSTYLDRCKLALCDRAVLVRHLLLYPAPQPGDSRAPLPCAVASCLLRTHLGRRRSGQERVKTHPGYTCSTTGWQEGTSSSISCRVCLVQHSVSKWVEQISSPSRLQSFSKGLLKKFIIPNPYLDKSLSQLTCKSWRYGWQHPGQIQWSSFSCNCPGTPLP